MLNEHFTGEAFDVETEFYRVFTEVIIIKCVLVFVEGVVHLPEFPLFTGGFGCLRSVFCMWMDSRQGEVSKDETEPMAEYPLNIFDNQISTTTVRTFVVSVLDKCHGCIR